MREGRHKSKKRTKDDKLVAYVLQTGKQTNK